MPPGAAAADPLPAPRVGPTDREPAAPRGAARRTAPGAAACARPPRASGGSSAPSPREPGGGAWHSRSTPWRSTASRRTPPGTSERTAAGRRLRRSRSGPTRHNRRRAPGASGRRAPRERRTGRAPRPPAADPSWSSPRRLERPAVARGDAVDPGVLRKLERADVGDDRPAIVGHHLASITRHLPEAVGRHVEERTDRLPAEPIDVVGRWRLEPALHDHPPAVADPSVAGRAEDVEALAPPEEEGARERHRQPGDESAVLADSGAERSVDDAPASRDGVGHRGPGGHPVGIETALRQRLQSRLVEHILPAGAGGREQHGGRPGARREPPP